MEWIIECVWQRKDGALSLTFTLWTFSFALEMRFGDDGISSRYKSKWYHDFNQGIYYATIAFGQLFVNNTLQKDIFDGNCGFCIVTDIIGIG